MKKFNVKLILRNHQVITMEVEAQDKDEIEKMDLLDLTESYLLENENNNIHTYDLTEIEEYPEDFLPINGGEYYIFTIDYIDIIEIR